MFILRKRAVATIYAVHLYLFSPTCIRERRKLLQIIAIGMNIYDARNEETKIRRCKANLYSREQSPFSLTRVLIAFVRSHTCVRCTSSIFVFAEFRNSRPVVSCITTTRPASRLLFTISFRSVILFNLRQMGITHIMELPACVSAHSSLLSYTQRRSLPEIWFNKINCCNHGG